MFVPQTGRQNMFVRTASGTGKIVWPRSAVLQKYTATIVILRFKSFQEKVRITTVLYAFK